MDTNTSKRGKSQKEQILDYLKQGGSLTPMDALKMFGCLRLGARIADIKGMGYLVHTEMVHDRRTGKRYASYSLV
jgi:hypothetical protein